MKTEYKNKKGVIILTIGDTENILPYENYEELKRIINSSIDASKNGADIIDFEKKTIYSIFDKYDLKNMEVEYDK